MSIRSSVLTTDKMKVSVVLSVSLLFVVMVSKMVVDFDSIGEFFLSENTF